MSCDKAQKTCHFEGEYGLSRSFRSLGMTGFICLQKKLAEFAARSRQTASLLAENSAGIFSSLKKDGSFRNRPFLCF